MVGGVVDGATEIVLSFVINAKDPLSAQLREGEVLQKWAEHWAICAALVRGAECCERSRENRFTTSRAGKVGV